MPRACPLCEDTRVEQNFLPNDYEFRIPCESLLYHCSSCGVHFLFPLPHLPDTYPQEYSPSRETGGKVRNAIFRGYHRTEARRIRKWARPGGKVLDVGCGDGGFLRAAQALGHWELEGIDWDCGAVSAARKDGLNVRVADLEMSELPEGRYDLIRMCHTLEHFADPVRVLRGLERALAPGGVIVGETPNIDCLDFRLFGKYWGGLHYPRHPWLFTPSSLKLAARRSGLELCSVKNCRRTVGWSRSLQNWVDDHLKLAATADGWRPWYPALIAGFLPVTLLQSLVGSTGVMEFVLRRETDALDRQANV